MAVKSLIETVTVGAGGVASITFADISQDGSDLLCVLSGRSQYNFGDNWRVAFNSLTIGFSSRQLFGTGSTAISATNSPAANGLAYVTDGDETANTFGNASLYISNYTSSANKPYSVDGVMENNATGARQNILAGLWSNTAAITSLTLSMENGPIAQYSTASLYKIKYD
jgi:hypothetical protein